MTLILAAALLLACGVIGALALVMIGIHTDDRHRSLTGNPPTRVAAFARRLLNASARGFHDESPRDHNHVRR